MFESTEAVFSVFNEISSFESFTSVTALSVFVAERSAKASSIAEEVSSEDGPSSSGLEGEQDKKWCFFLSAF